MRIRSPAATTCASGRRACASGATVAMAANARAPVAVATSTAATATAAAPVPTGPAELIAQRVQGVVDEWLGAKVRARAPLSCAHAHARCGRADASSRGARAAS